MLDQLETCTLYVKLGMECSKFSPDSFGTKMVDCSTSTIINIQLMTVLLSVSILTSIISLIGKYY